MDLVDYTDTQKQSCLSFSKVLNNIIKNLMVVTSPWFGFTIR